MRAQLAITVLRFREVASNALATRKKPQESLVRGMRPSASCHYGYHRSEALRRRASTEGTREKEPYSCGLRGEATDWTIGVHLLTWLAEGKDTNGRFALADVVIPKVGGKPPPHPRGRVLLCA
jgi:hypothetical protein